MIPRGNSEQKRVWFGKLAEGSQKRYRIIVTALHEIEIRHLYISPAHNFLGHHGKTAGDHPSIEVGEIRCVAGRGIEGDRYFDFKNDYKGQITFFALEVFNELRREIPQDNVLPSAFRRNVITQGVDLNSLIGMTFEIQGVQFQGVEECKPCYWMDRAYAPGAEEWLKGKGGLRARILSDGILRNCLRNPQI